MSAGTTERAMLYFAQELGWPVLPLHWWKDSRCSCGNADCISPAKHPIAKLVPNGCKDATTSAEQIAAWGAQYPNANVGMASEIGAAPIVIDIDGPEGEDALRKRFAVLPQTVEVITSRGRHLYYAARDGVTLGNSKEKLGPKIDMRGARGYVVTWPSVHQTGHVYRWAPGCSPDEIELAPLPDDILAALLTDKSPASEATRPRASGPIVQLERSALRQFDAWLAKVPTGLSEGENGGRKLTAFRIASRALESMPLSDALNVVHEWNSFNHPPLSDREIERKVYEAAGERRPRVAA